MLGTVSQKLCRAFFMSSFFNLEEKEFVEFVSRLDALSVFVNSAKFAT